MIEKYLLAQDTFTWTECLRGHSPLLSMLAEVQDKLGWDNFVAGRISNVFLEAVAPYLSNPRSCLTPAKWCQTLQSKLLQMTHKQWIFRNAHVHYKKLDGLTMAQHEDILAKVDELMWTDPSELLDKHHYLLHADFHQLTEGNAGDRLNWIAAMDSALTAATYVRDGNEYTGDPGFFDFDSHSTTTATHNIDQSLIDDDDDFSRQVRRDLNVPIGEALATRQVCRDSAAASILDQDRSIASTLDTSTSAFSDTIVWPLAASLPSSWTKKTTSAPMNQIDETNDDINIHSRGNLLSER